MTAMERAKSAFLAELHRQGEARGFTVESNTKSAQVNGSFEVEPLVRAVLVATHEPSERPGAKGKLGFWNRLALVAGALTILIVPSWWVLSSNAEMMQVRQTGYNTCMTAAREANSNLDADFCWEIWMEPDGVFLGWSNWLDAVGVVTVGVVAAYILIVAAVWIVKWVWRGRPIGAA